MFYSSQSAAVNVNRAAHKTCRTFPTEREKGECGKEDSESKHLQPDAPVHSTSLISAFYLPAAGLSSYKNESMSYMLSYVCVLQVWSYLNTLISWVSAAC